MHKMMIISSIYASVCQYIKYRANHSSAKKPSCQENDRREHEKKDQKSENNT